MARTYEQEREHKWRRRGIMGITYQEYESMRLAQREQCLMCGTHVNGNGALDHNHETGKIRGILCNECNLALGILERYIRDGSAALYLQISELEEDPS